MLNLEKLESLVKIKLTDEERIAAFEYFDCWIEKFGVLESIDTESIEPLISVSTLENVLREDISYKLFDRETLIENAPEQHDGYIVVPRILE